MNFSPLDALVIAGITNDSLLRCAGTASAGSAATALCKE